MEGAGRDIDGLAGCCCLLDAVERVGGLTVDDGEALVNGGVVMGSKPVVPAV